MPREFDVDYGRLAAEVANVQAVSDAVNEAATAAATAQTMSEGAFGLLCSGMVPPAQIFQSIGVKALNAAAEAQEALALNLRTAAADYEAVDSEGAKTYNQLQGLIA